MHTYSIRLIRARTNLLRKPASKASKTYTPKQSVTVIGRNPRTTDETPMPLRSPQANPSRVAHTSQSNQSELLRETRDCTPDFPRVPRSQPIKATRCTPKQPAGEKSHIKLTVPKQRRRFSQMGFPAPPSTHPATDNVSAAFAFPRAGAEFVPEWFFAPSALLVMAFVSARVVPSGGAGASPHGERPQS